MMSFTNDNISIEFDPTNHFSSTPFSIIADAIGIIPQWLNDYAAYPADLAIDMNYQHGGGWHSFEGFTINPENGVLSYPEDPDLHPMVKYNRPLWEHEDVYQYESGWVAVYNTKTKSLNVARID